MDKPKPPPEGLAQAEEVQYAVPLGQFVRKIRRILGEREMDEEGARAVAEHLGGDVWETGGGICLVVKHRSDGKVVAISDEAVCVYADVEALGTGKPEETIILV